MSSISHCPRCGVSFQGSPIPAEYIAAGYYGDETHYSRLIGIEVRGEYDGVLFWRCPDCGHAFHRWPEGSPYHRRAAGYIAQTNNTMSGDTYAF